MEDKEMSLQHCFEKQCFISAATKTGISTAAVLPFPSAFAFNIQSTQGTESYQLRYVGHISMTSGEAAVIVWWSLCGIIGGAFLACTLQCKDRGKENFGIHLATQLFSYSPSSAEQGENMRWSVGRVQDSWMRKREGCLWKQSKTIWSLLPSEGNVQPLREKQKSHYT